MVDEIIASHLVLNALFINNSRMSICWRMQLEQVQLVQSREYDPPKNRPLLGVYNCVSGMDISDISHIDLFVHRIFYALDIANI